ncbi:hypothetical protein DV735_g1011, partial [Chaetothyriales sp. CBS 134920]
MDPFRVRLNCVDHYQAVPSDEFDPPVPLSATSGHAKDRPRVSVLRVFGATDTGQKVLMHVHGAFQYTYIEYSGSLVPADVEAAISALHSSIDHALAVSYRANPYDGKHKYVAHISLVKGVPFYGFHVGYKFFLKIYLLNPLHMTRLADLLREGAVMKRVLQPYESHLQYIAQWMCDYNLYGCAYIDCARVKFRSPVPRYADMTDMLHQWHDRSIGAEDISDEFDLPKQGHCALEVDVCVQDILNRGDIEPRPIHHDFIERLRPIPEGAKLVQSMAGLWKDEARRRQMHTGGKGLTGSASSPDITVTMSADPRGTNAGGWIHEAEFRERVAEIAAEERDSSQGADVAFDTFVKPTPLEQTVQTALESVEDFYPHRMERLKVQGQDQRSDRDQVVVDEDTLDRFTQEEEDSALSGNDFSDSDERGSPREGPAECLPQSRREKEESPGASNSDPMPRRRKRRKLLKDADDVLPDLPSEEDPVQAKQPATAIPRGSQKPKLPFPVVKDPLRLSQKSDSQKTSSQRTSSQRTYSQKTSSQRTSSQKTSSEAATSVAATPVPRLHFGHASEGELLIFSVRPPASDFVASTLQGEGLPDVIYQPAYYSNEDDIPDRAQEYAGREFKVESVTVPYLPDFDPAGKSAATYGNKAAVLLNRTAEEVKESQRRRRCRLPRWSIDAMPPSRAQVEEWLEGEAQRPKQLREGFSQIDGPTQKNKHGFKYSQKQDSARVRHETQYMSIMSLEIHVNTRGSLAPNPEEDAVSCIFWCVQDDEGGGDSEHDRTMGILMVADEAATAKKISRGVGGVVEQERSELDLLTRLADIVRLHDPDILTGFEVHNSSWGYLIERARLKYELDLCDEVSRIKEHKEQSHSRSGRDQDRWGFNHTSAVRVTGRHTVNIWRAMRSELNLLQYTLENIAFHLLHRRIPHYAFADLSRWYRSSNVRDQARVMAYFRSRVQLDLDILQANDLVARTSEQARVLGVDWFSVISRGSQFKVESLMFRIAKAENMVLVSPSRRQVGGQNALECLPLVMEPQSDFYTSPVVVLDFQSLYPSVMIAYNYCYSTFLGRLVSWRGTNNKMGFTQYQRQRRLIELLQRDNKITIAPNGIMYAKPAIRKALLAKMLSEILETRVMVKSSMKCAADDDDTTALHRLLNNRQLALKMIANVTYGYTSASFSGRMPCAEIADSIVQTGRETLERAVAHIHSVARWRADVVYGDTDSLFIHLPGRTRPQAFALGAEIAAAITAQNPRPVKLRFEKVYHPCVLLAKKRYVGFKYESADQADPVFDAKGIETVRRDGTPATQKMQENALKILFRTADLSRVKQEVKLGTYTTTTTVVPGALVAARRMRHDPRLEPQYGERVPYVVVVGGHSRLIDRCVAPDVLLCDDNNSSNNSNNMALDAEYYITRALLPPLDRVLRLVGANVRRWYDQMPKYHRRITTAVPATATLDKYLPVSTCVRRVVQVEAVCRSCAGLAPGATASEIACDSKDCAVFYTRVRLGAQLRRERAVLQPGIQLLERDDPNECELEW